MTFSRYFAPNKVPLEGIYEYSLHAWYIYNVCMCVCWECDNLICHLFIFAPLYVYMHIKRHNQWSNSILFTCNFYLLLVVVCASLLYIFPFELCLRWFLVFLYVFFIVFLLRVDFLLISFAQLLVVSMDAPIALAMTIICNANYCSAKRI